MATELTYSKELTFHETPIPGLLLADLPVHGDSRGWFKENWQRAKMTAGGLPDFGPVQNNISFNADKGVTRGIHAEPWDKYISIGSGRVFGAWVDLREGDSFGTVFTTELDPTTAIFVPRGVGNSFQALEENTVYTYLVNDHWSEGAQSQYTFLNLADETVNIPWPIPLDQAELSDKDKAHPRLRDVVPMKPKKTLVIGGNGQLGKALHLAFPDADMTTRETLDLTSPTLKNDISWQNYDVVINAAAYTNVDEAETAAGRVAAWQNNVHGVTELVKITATHHLTLVHVSSDYVFDGTKEHYSETDSFSPLGVYGQTKAAGDALVSTLEKYYIIRTSWVIGDGTNFVRTMQSLARRGIAPQVVDDQIGRLSFTSDIAAGIRHILTTKAPYGTYNLSGEGEPTSWADIAKGVYRLEDHNESEVTPVTTAVYYEGKQSIAPRPHSSVLSLDKIKATGFSPKAWRESLQAYVHEDENKEETV